MGMVKVLLGTTNLLRPVLTKCIPKKMLSAAHNRFLAQSILRLGREEIQPFDREKYPRGINLIGNIKGDSGLGQSCRLLAYILESVEYPLSIMQHSISPKLSTLDQTYDDRLSTVNPNGINVFHMNPHELASAYFQLGKTVWDGHYNIAYWLWELEEFPDEWVNCIYLLDEIWAPAEYISESIRKKTDKPVITVPYYVTARTDDQYNREYFGLPEDKFLFLMMFDCGSMMERKNPQAVIKAFKSAFQTKEENAGLVIKINGATSDDMEQIKRYIGGYDNIYLINQVFSKVEINSMIKCVNAVVSLHRAEGFGLVMAEAMLNGVPCIATNWSANTEFMNSDVACMVDYKLVELDRNIGPYKKGNRWADPDVEQAAAYMRQLYLEPEYGRRKAALAQEYIAKHLGLNRAVSIVNDRVATIYGDRAE